MDDIEINSTNVVVINGFKLLTDITSICIIREDSDIIGKADHKYRKMFKDELEIFNQSGDVIAEIRNGDKNSPMNILCIYGNIKIHNENINEHRLYFRGECYLFCKVELYDSDTLKEYIVINNLHNN